MDKFVKGEKEMWKNASEGMHSNKIILNYRNVAKHLWREPQIIKFENAFHIWINIGYICEHTLSAVSRVK